MTQDRLHDAPVQKSDQERGCRTGCIGQCDTSQLSFEVLPIKVLDLHRGVEVLTKPHDLNLFHPFYASMSRQRRDPQVKVVPARKTQGRTRINLDLSGKGKQLFQT